MVIILVIFGFGLKIGSGRGRTWKSGVGDFLFSICAIFYVVGSGFCLFECGADSFR